MYILILLVLCIYSMVHVLLTTLYTRTEHLLNQRKASRNPTAQLSIMWGSLIDARKVILKKSSFFHSR